MNRRFPQTKRLGRALVFLGWLCLALTYTWFIARPWLAREKWANTEGQVQQVAFTQAPFGHGKCRNSARDPRETIMVRVVYRYEVGGRWFESDQFTHDQRGTIDCSRAEAHATKAKYERAESVTVHYDPRNPERSLLRLPNATMFYLGAIALGISLLAFVASSFGTRASRPR